MKLDPYLIPCTKINSASIKDLNLRATMIKPEEENTGESFMTLDFVMIFFDMTPKTQARAKIGKLACIKIKNCTSKDNINRLKRRVAV